MPPVSPHATPAAVMARAKHARTPADARYRPRGTAARSSNTVENDGDGDGMAMASTPGPGQTVDGPSADIVDSTLHSLLQYEPSGRARSLASDDPSGLVPRHSLSADARLARPWWMTEDFRFKLGLSQ
ncbi:hypothetical protein CDD83_9226 [Cordyceps sp. RAO-2017]|nr:hypothetical protein CDD83_9226 [Cordyceps sp. RAO-2017]